MSQPQPSKQKEWLDRPRKTYRRHEIAWRGERRCRATNETCLVDKDQESHIARGIPRRTWSVRPWPALAASSDGCDLESDFLAPDSLAQPHELLRHMRMASRLPRWCSCKSAHRAFRRCDCGCAPEDGEQDQTRYSCPADGIRRTADRGIVTARSEILQLLEIHFRRAQARQRLGARQTEAGISKSCFEDRHPSRRRQ
jgi:hypothetical protein